jgi:hypothetical protein
MQDYISHPVRRPIHPPAHKTLEIEDNPQRMKFSKSTSRNKVKMLRGYQYFSMIGRIGLKDWKVVFVPHFITLLYFLVAIKNESIVILALQCRQLTSPVQKS